MSEIIKSIESGKEQAICLINGANARTTAEVIEELENGYLAFFGQSIRGWIDGNPINVSELPEEKQKDVLGNLLSELNEMLPDNISIGYHPYYPETIMIASQAWWEQEG
jgi:hypothetical protein